MISKEIYLKLKEEFSNVASWAIWEQPTEGAPKSNMRSVSMFDREDILELLNPNYVLIGLNGSGVHDNYMDISKPWHNFHSSNPRGHDYKLRYALMGTPYWGAYITDAIKYLPEVDSEKVSRFLRNRPDVVNDNMQILEKEIEILGTNPTLVCLGDKSYEFVKEHFGKRFAVKKIVHYSYQIGKEDYRERVLKVLLCDKGDAATSLTYIPKLPILDPHFIILPDDTTKIQHPNVQTDGIPSLEKYLKLTGLDIPQNWIGDIRNHLLSLFEPIIEGTDFSIRKNVTDTTKNGLDLFYKNESRRCMGFAKMKNMCFLVYPTKPFLEEISHKTKLPERNPKKAQAHMKMTLNEFWQFLYKITH